MTTGHLNGVITVNLEEADDTYRQINRQQLGENSRTLLGHFRHESAHYFWQRFLSDTAHGMIRCGSPSASASAMNGRTTPRR